ncbi:MAG: type II secretion system protein [Candidatus Zixiibacteriota bacterium]
MRNCTRTQQGFTLVELVIIIVILGVIASFAARTMNQSIDTAKYEHTKTELDQLALAIVGNSDLYARGARSDFGYVGDVGSLPPNLDALTANPGGYSTWNGPYIETGAAADDFKRDAWGTLYTYTDTLLRSTGSGSNIDKTFANSSADLLANSLSGYVVDAGGEVPGSVRKDSLSIAIIYPDGSGSTTTVTTTPNAHGNFSFSGLPIGSHTLRIIYLPDADTANYSIGIGPGTTNNMEITFPADLW